MKTSFPVSLLLFVAVFSVSVFAAQLPGPGSNTSRRPVPQPAAAQQIFVCAFNVPNGPSYVNETLIHADAASDPAIIEAWFEYLRAAYGIPFEKGARPPAGSGCYALNNDEPSAQRYAAQLEEWGAKAKSGLIRVHWSYTPGPAASASSPQAGQGSGAVPAAVAGNATAGSTAAAAPITTSAVRPSAPAAPAPPKTATPAAAVTAPDKPVQAARYAVCFGTMGPPTPSLFFSDPFQVTTPRTKVWSDAFREMLQQKYHFVGTIACGIRGATLEAAKTFAQTEKNSSHGGRKMVDTGWKFEE